MWVSARSVTPISSPRQGRLARNLGNDRFVGIEYYSDLGKIGDFPAVRRAAATDIRGD
jgi:hypothetical protein